MDKIQELKQKIKSEIKWSTNGPNIIGGQSCGTIYYSINLECEELDIKITVGTHHSVLKNKQLAYKLFEIALDEIIK